MSNLFNKLSDLDKAYIAGFLDGDGSIMVQIIPDKTRKFKFYIRISIGFYQRSKHHWYILWLKETLGSYGSIAKRDSGMSELIIVANDHVRKVLVELHPYLKIKKPLCKLVLSIMDDLGSIQTEVDFLKVCLKVDKVAEHTYSKKRTVTAQTVAEKLNLKLPVETSNNSKELFGIEVKSLPL